MQRRSVGEQTGQGGERASNTIQGERRHALYGALIQAEFRGLSREATMGYKGHLREPIKRILLCR